MRPHGRTHGSLKIATYVGSLIVTESPPVNNQSEIFESHRADVFRRAVRLARCAATAEDVVQDTFIKWQAQCENEIPVNPRAWLLTVASRRVFELARKTSMQSVPETILNSIECGDEGNANRIDKSYLQNDVLHGLAELTDMQRETLLGKIADDLTFREIAERLDIAIPTVKTHYIRALRSLRSKLSPRWSDYYEDDV